MNSDGTLIADASSSTDEMHLWSVDSGWQAFGGVPGFSLVSAWAMSADGSTVVGALAPYEAFRWNHVEGFVLMGTLGTVSVSGDGRVICGMDNAAPNNQTIRWTEEGGVQTLGVLPGATWSGLGYCSADGSVVASCSGGPDRATEAFSMDRPNRNGWARRLTRR